MAEEVAPVEEKKSKGKKALIIPAVVLSIGLAGGGYFFLAGKKGDATEGPATTTTTALGSVVRLKPITVNLADGHVLKVGMALQAVAEPKDPHMAAILSAGGHGAKPNPDSPLSGEEAKALDEAIHVFGNLTFDELSKPGGRQHAQEELVEKVKHAYHDAIVDVYFTDFVMS